MPPTPSKKPPKARGKTGNSSTTAGDIAAEGPSAAERAAGVRYRTKQALTKGKTPPARNAGSVAKSKGKSQRGY